VEDISTDVRPEVALPLAGDRRERFDVQLRRAEDFLRASLQALESRESGEGVAVVGPPADTWVATYERASGHQAAARAAGAPPILVVDLQESSRAALGSLLRTSGYPVLEAGSSSDFPADAEITPRLIVFDPGPHLDAALRTVARMRIQQEKPVPVVLISEECSPEMRSRALAIGCAEVLPKPCPPVQLLTAVARLVEAGPPPE
jgi:CheY-like chemotaxis protein